MKQKNKIDFTTEPEFSFLYDLPPSDFMSEHFDHFAVIDWIDSELEHTFSGFVVSLIALSYLRINGTSADNKFHIPLNASFDTLTYSKGQNFFVDIFNRYKIICEANAILSGTASILEQYYMAGAKVLSAEYQEKIAGRIFDLDWSEKGLLNADGPDMSGQVRQFAGYTYPDDWNDKKFTNWACGVYVERELIRGRTGSVTHRRIQATLAEKYSFTYQADDHVWLTSEGRCGGGFRPRSGSAG
jgi:hypothetical protein